ncbi:membrane protein [Actinoplanes sp. OR16]|nr:membrane protein [Actinoplanes sp. OR16]
MPRRVLGDRLGPGDRGASPVEFAIIAGPMLVLGFIVLQAGFVFHAQSIALGAATQGVNAARGYHSSAGAGDRQARQFLAAAGTGLTNQNVTVGRSGTAVTVTVTGRAVALIPGLSFSIRRTAHGPVERVTQP